MPGGRHTPHALRADTRVRVVPDVVRRDFPKQTVVLNLRTGRYHGLNPTAARMLNVLEQGASLTAAAQLIAQQYQQPQSEVERDIRELCHSLLERGLVELDEPAAALGSAPQS